MRAPQRIDSKKIQEVASLLVPLRDYLLLLPNVSVAEIVPITQVSPVSNAPAWYLGDCIWREQKVPLLSFEVLNGDTKAGVSSRARFAVLNSTGVSDDLPFIAIVTQGIPRLARVNEEEIREREGDKKPFELMHVSWAGEDAVIPDVSRMEQAYLDYRSQTGLY
jgi:chemosensory pili system protein ChpC